jgi:hypothetical protein
MSALANLACSYCKGVQLSMALMDHMLACPSRPLHLRSTDGRMEVFVASHAITTGSLASSSRSHGRDSHSQHWVAPPGGDYPRTHLQPAPVHVSMGGRSGSPAAAGPVRRRPQDRPAVSSTAGHAQSAKSTKWRAEHDALQAAMRAARGGMRSKASTSGPLQANPHQHVGLVPCPHCRRTFSQTAAGRHIPRCATTYNKPKPPPQLRESGGPQLRGSRPQRPRTSHGVSGGRRATSAAASKWGSPSRFRETSGMPSGGGGAFQTSGGAVRPASRSRAVSRGATGSRGGGRPAPPSGGGGGGTAGNNTSMDNPLATSHYQVMNHEVPSSRPGQRR